MVMAPEKHATTITTQVALAARDWAVEMCHSPWTVEFSKKSRRIAEAMTSVVLVTCLVSGLNRD